MTDLLRDLPDDEKPREKLARLGPASLDNAELLALFLGSGIKGRGVVQVSRDILRHFGSLHNLGAADLDSLRACPGLGPAKASLLHATFELGRRLAREQMEAAPLDCPERIHQYFAPQLATLEHEKLLAAIVNTRLRHVATVEISSGTITGTTSHPRDVLRPILLKNAYGFILLHNHPSGDPSPSRADIDFTENLHEAAKLLQIRFIDHLIIGRPAPGRDPYYSFREFRRLDD